DEDGVFRNGIFSYGGIHDYRYTWPLIYRPLVSADSWTIEATKILLGQDVLCEQFCSIQFSTAIPYFYGPQEKVTQAHRLLQLDTERMDTQAPVMNCKAVYPLLTIQFGEHQLEWKLSDFWEKVSTVSTELCSYLAQKMERIHVTCKLGIRTSSSGPGWILGHRMMFNLFTVFDSRWSRMGIAKASRP
ncbi:hypothetical protein X801_04351, partial [Opisthorchis viverrini]